MVMAHSFMVFLLLLWQCIRILPRHHPQGVSITNLLDHHRLWAVSTIPALGPPKALVHFLIRDTYLGQDDGHLHLHRCKTSNKVHQLMATRRMAE